MGSLTELIISPYPESREELYSLLLRHASIKARKLMYNPEDAEDIAQDALVRFLRTFKVSEDTTDASIRMFLNRAIFCSYVDFLRKNEKYREGRVPDDKLVTEDETEMERISEEVEELIKDLSPRHKQIYKYVMVEGMTSVEVAKLLGVTSSTVRSLLASLREKIRGSISFEI